MWGLLSDYFLLREYGGVNLAFSLLSSVLGPGKTKGTSMGPKYWISVPWGLKTRKVAETIVGNIGTILKEDYLIS